MYIDPYNAVFILGNMKMYSYFLLFLNIEMAQLVEMFPHGK